MKNYSKLGLFTSKGRLNYEPQNRYRTPFQRDRDRIIHSASFRRLKHKTQVFVNTEGDHYRTRLTHSMEVSQIARTLARSLGLNEDLAETLSLSHDLGHTPFGHAGEEALNDCMKEYGGFNHNVQTLRILTQLEERYAKFDGLNLTWETLEGIVKHNGPLLSHNNGIPDGIAKYNQKHNLDLSNYPGPEAQVAAVADDIAYNNHDIDDGLRAGLFSLDDLFEVPMVGEIFISVRKAYPSLNQSRLVHEAIRRMIGLMITDIVKESQARLRDSGCDRVEQIRTLQHPVITFSSAMASNDRAVKKFLYNRMYRHYKVNRMSSKARTVVKDLFNLFISEPDCLPDEWQIRCNGSKTMNTAQVVSDYIACMTDRFAFLEHKRLFDLPS